MAGRDSKGRFVKGGGSGRDSKGRFVKGGGGSGGKKIRRRLRQVKDRMVNAARAATYLGGSVVMTASKERVPVDMGALRTSGYVAIPKKTRRVIEAEFGYGGPAAKYAVIQHETLDFNHPSLANIRAGIEASGSSTGEAKFLEKALDEKSFEVTALMEKIFRRTIATGVAPPLVVPHHKRPDQAGTAEEWELKRKARKTRKGGG